MKRLYRLCATAVTIAAMALVCSCEKENGPVEGTDELPIEVGTSHVYSVSIKTTDRTVSTKGLEMIGNTLNAKWKNGEKVKVFGTTFDGSAYNPSGSVSLGTLTAVESNGAVVLNGDLDFAAYDAEIASWNIDGVTDIESLLAKGVSPQIYLFYPDYPFSFNGQNGEFDFLSFRFDKAWARMFIQAIDKVSGTVTLVNVKGKEQASFYNPASIFKFTFKDRDNNDIIPKTVTISGSQLFSEFSYGGGTKGDVVVNCPEDKEDNMIFVALMEENSDGTLQISVEDKDGHSWLYVYYNKSVISYADPYTLWFNSDPTFTGETSELHRGEYLSWIIEMDRAKNLATLTSDYTASDREILYGTLPDNINLSIADNATVALKGVTIGDKHSKAGITCLGDATILLKGENSVNASSIDIYPAIQPDGTLTIKGDGSLTATGGENRPGIGGSTKAKNVGNVIIESGTITATGGANAPGIGTCGIESSNYKNSCTMGNITITGGTVVAKGSYGDDVDSSIESSEQAAAGIGSGMYGVCGNITISGGVVEATGGKLGSGIGSGTGDRNPDEQMCGNITISGGTVTATSLWYGAGIGTGKNPSRCGDIQISGGTVTASAKNFAAAIGTGFVSSQGGNSTCGTITVTSNITSLTAKVAATMADIIGKGGAEGTPEAVSGTVTIDGVANATQTSTFPNLNSSLTSSNPPLHSIDVVWTLTKK